MQSGGLNKFDIDACSLMVVVRPIVCFYLLVDNWDDILGMTMNQLLRPSFSHKHSNIRLLDIDN